MDGLSDDSDSNSKLHSSVFYCPRGVSDKSSSCRYASYDGSGKKLYNSFESSLKSSSEIIAENKYSTDFCKPLWQHLSEEALLAKLDPNVAWSYRQALSSRQSGSNFSRNIRSMGSSPLNSSSFSKKLCLLPGTEDKIVIYFTSLGGIRKTHEDYCSVKMIFRGFKVAVDERDISMDSSYKMELQSALGGKTVSLPQVFIRGKHVGSAEEIKRLNEVGGLAKLLEGFPIQDPWFVCKLCGDARFLPCPSCKGSRKIFDEEEGELRRCPDCNENGLIRCPGCC